MTEQATKTREPFALTESDYAQLEDGYIDRASADAARLYRVDSQEGASTVGQVATFNRDYSGIIFRIHHPITGQEFERVLRLDQPHGSMKYVYPPRPNRFYLDLRIRPEWLRNPQIPIVFVEGFKKALAMQRIAFESSTDDIPLFIVIATNGCWGWRGKTGKESGIGNERVDTKGPLNDFEWFDWDDREVTILFDANAATNPSVGSARRALAQELHGRGARVFIADLPASEGINGPDDLAGREGPDAVLRVLDSRYPAIRPVESKPAESVQERIERGAELRALVARAANQPDAASDQVRAVLGAKLHRRIAYLMAQGGQLETGPRDLIWTLIAIMGDGETGFDFKYKHLYPLLWPLEPGDIENGRLSSTCRQRVRRRFDELAEAEAACGLRFVEFRPGYQTDDQNVDSYARLLIFDLVEEIEGLAMTDPTYSRSKAKAFESAVARFVEARTGRLRPEKSPQSQNETRRLQRAWKQAHGLIESTIDRMEKQGFEPWAIEHDLRECLSPRAIEFLKPNLDISEGLKNASEKSPKTPEGGGNKLDTSKPQLTPLVTPDNFARFPVFNKNSQAPKSGQHGQ